MTWGVGVVVPARDEAERLRACLDALRAAIAQIGLPANHCHVVVVADDCHDDTAAMARRALVEWGEVIEIDAGSAGAARAAGVAVLLRRLSAVAPERLWLLTTDADTIVPCDWLDAHLRWARAGAVAAAGVIRVDSFDEHPAVVAERFTAIYDGPLDQEHPHVHAANLGVRADVYAAVGGWRAVVSGEEHHLWRAVRDLGLAMVSPRSLQVTTSARATSRVRGGFADWLLELAALEVS